jgi:hypothetical protein
MSAAYGNYGYLAPCNLCCCFIASQAFDDFLTNDPLYERECPPMPTTWVGGVWDMAPWSLWSCALVGSGAAQWYRPNSPSWRYYVEFCVPDPGTNNLSAGDSFAITLGGGKFRFEVTVGAADDDYGTATFYVDGSAVWTGQVDGVVEPWTDCLGLSACVYSYSPDDPDETGRLITLGFTRIDYDGQWVMDPVDFDLDDMAVGIDASADVAVTAAVLERVETTPRQIGLITHDDEGNPVTPYPVYANCGHCCRKCDACIDDEIPDCLQVVIAGITGDWMDTTLPGSSAYRGKWTCLNDTWTLLGACDIYTAFPGAATPNEIADCQEVHQNYPDDWDEAAACCGCASDRANLCRSWQSNCLYPTEAYPTTLNVWFSKEDDEFFLNAQLGGAGCGGPFTWKKSLGSERIDCRALDVTLGSDDMTGGTAVNGDLSEATLHVTAVHGQTPCGQAIRCTACGECGQVVNDLEIEMEISFGDMPALPGGYYRVVLSALNGVYALVPECQESSDVAPCLFRYVFEESVEIEFFDHTGTKLGYLSQWVTEVGIIFGGGPCDRYWTDDEPITVTPYWRGYSPTLDGPEYTEHDFPFDCSSLSDAISYEHHSNPTSARNYGIVTFHAAGYGRGFSVGFNSGFGA